MNKGMGWTAIIAAVLVALTAALSWPAWLQYIWAIVVLIVGIMAMK